MDVERMKALLEGAARLRRPSRERTLFDIGARGYFENPTTDLLAFFLDPEAEHGFGNAVLSALLDSLPEALQPAACERYLTRPPVREWVTSRHQRIDLVLESDRWVLAVEHKVYHGLHNDFAHYGEDIALRLSGQDSRQVLCVVLSPGGQAPSSPGWLGLGYPDFLRRLRSAAGSLYEQHGESKWLLLLREFVIHLENLTMTDTLTDAQEQFALEHLGEIEALTKAKNDALVSLRLRLQEGLNTRLDDLGLPITSWQENWPVGPALRFVPHGWQGYSSVVIYLEPQIPKQVWVQTYIDRRNGDLAELAGKGIDCNQFDEHKVGRSVYNFYHGFSSMDWDAVEEAVASYLRAIMAMEQGWQREQLEEVQGD